MVTNHIIPALVTPFDAAGALNETALQSHVRGLTKQGATGFYVGGSSGEFPLLSVAERQKILEIVREEVDKDKLLICHVGAPNPHDAIALARHAGLVGVDMVSSVPPTYYPYSTKEIEAYFLDVADTAGVPLLIYNVPALAGASLSAGQISAWMRNDQIGGVKFTSYDLFALQLIRAGNPNKLVLIGHDELFLPALSAGVDGGIGSSFNILLPRFVKLAAHYANHDVDGARALQNEANSIIKDLLKHGIFPSIKYVLSELGLDCGQCRKPFQPLCEDAKAFLKNNVLSKL